MAIIKSFQSRCFLISDTGGEFYLDRHIKLIPHSTLKSLLLVLHFKVECGYSKLLADENIFLQKIKSQRDIKKSAGYFPFSLETRTMRCKKKMEENGDRS